MAVLVGTQKAASRVKAMLRREGIHVDKLLVDIIVSAVYDQLAAHPWQEVRRSLRHHKATNMAKPRQVGRLPQIFSKTAETTFRRYTRTHPASASGRAIHFFNPQEMAAIYELERIARSKDPVMARAVGKAIATCRA